MSYARIVQRNALVARRYWRGSLFFSFLTPLLFLSAMGLGMSALVARSNPQAFGPGGYLAFVATGLLGSSCMNTATFESTFPILAKIMWQKNYEAMLATRLRVRDLLAGELAWMTIRLFMIAIPFFFVITLFGVVRQPYGVLAIPAAVLTGLGFASWVMAYTATLESDANFASLFRFVVTPLFLFSGTFFPLDQLPSWIRAVANATPLYHGIELIRGLALYGVVGPAKTAWHLTYLTVFLVAGAALAYRNFKRRLVT